MLARSPNTTRDGATGKESLIPNSCRRVPRIAVKGHLAGGGHRSAGKLPPSPSPSVHGNLPSPGGKQQHVVETLNIVAMRTSLLMDAHVRPDFTARRLWRAWRRRCSPPGGPARSPWIVTRVGLAVRKGAISLRPCSAWRPVWTLTSRCAIRIIPNKSAITSLPS